MQGEDIGEIWKNLQEEIGVNKSKEFGSLPSKSRIAVLELQREKFVFICRLQIKINEDKRGHPYEKKSRRN